MFFLPFRLLILCALLVTLTPTARANAAAPNVAVPNAAAPNVAVPNAAAPNVAVPNAAAPDAPASDAEARSIVVTSLSDAPTDGVCDAAAQGDGCTMREAITAANAAPDANIIRIPLRGVINLTSALPAIKAPLTLVGSGADALTVRRDSGGDYRVFNVLREAQRVALSDITVSNGRPDGNGAGLLCYAQLDLRRCAFTGNANFGTLKVGGGVALYDANGTFADCTFSDNDAGDLGGGIGFFDYGDHELSLINCTVSGNRAANTGYGGGIGFITTGKNSVLRVAHCSIVGNATLVPPLGGGIMCLGYHEKGDATLILSDTLFSDNSIPAFRASTEKGGRATVISRGHNFIDDNSAPSNDDETDLFNLPARLGPLADNGGPTQTHALLVGSPAIGAADPQSPLRFDQRGTPRPQGASPDIGAFEG